jgi:predicted GNAT superfamily acetyltransferase
MCENIFTEGSSLFLAAYAEAAGGGFVEDAAHLVGFSYGFVGVRDKALAFNSLDNLWFYAQFTAVLPAYQGFDLGVLLKEFQGEVLRDVLGIHEVVCTYDPLTGVNAHRNVRHFGMNVLEYRVATYGEYGGLLNRKDVPTDRFFMSWDLRAKEPRPAYDIDPLLDDAHQALRVETLPVQGRSRLLHLEVVKDVVLDGSPERRLVRIPANFYSMLQETDVPAAEVRRIPVDWRLATRRAFRELLAAGYRVVDFQRRSGLRPENYYILARD